MKPEERERRLLLYLSGELRGEKRAEVEEWLAADEETASYMQDLELLRGEMKALPERAPSAGHVRRAFQRHVFAGSRPVRHFTWLRHAGIAALFLIGFGLAGHFAIDVPSGISVSGPEDAARAAGKRRLRRAVALRRRQRRRHPIRIRIAQLKERIHGLKSKYVH